MYAKAVFETFGCDAVTVSPYLGQDALRPFFEYKDRGVFVLCLTSNRGADDFQLPDLHLNVAKKVQQWNVSGNVGLVVGATFPEKLKQSGKLLGRCPSLSQVLELKGVIWKKLFFMLMTDQNYLILINASRSVIYASPEKILQNKQE